MSTHGSNTERILEIFRRIEERDPKRPNPARMFELFQPDIQFHCPPSLPYARADTNRPPITWDEVWNPLQPTVEERRMDPRVIAEGGDEVVVLWRQRGVSPGGERYQGEVLGLYRFREGKLAPAKMFYFDSEGVTAFLRKARNG